jgi:hypothetical protein
MGGMTIPAREIDSSSHTIIICSIFTSVISDRRPVQNSRKLPKIFIDSTSHISVPQLLWRNERVGYGASTKSP